MDNQQRNTPSLDYLMKSWFKTKSKSLHPWALDSMKTDIPGLFFSIIKLMFGRIQESALCRLYRHPLYSITEVIHTHQQCSWPGSTEWFQPEWRLWGLFTSFWDSKCYRTNHSFGNISHETQSLYSFESVTNLDNRQHCFYICWIGLCLRVCLYVGVYVCKGC